MTELLAGYRNVVDLCLLNGTVALAAWLLLRVDRFSLATGGLMALGAYAAVVATTRFGLSFPAALALGTLLGVLAAALVAWPVLRLRGDYFALATLAFSEVVRVVAFNWDGVTGGALGITGIPPLTETWHLALAFALPAAAVLWLEAGPVGRAVAALRSDDAPAQALGLDIGALRFAAFVASGALCGLAGGLAGHLNFFVGPNDFALLRSMDAVAAAVLGGTGQVLGPLVGATLLTVLPEALRFSAQVREVAVALVLLLAVLLLPRGVLSLGHRA